MADDVPASARRDHQARQRLGRAVGASFADAFQKALDADAQSAFGGIIAVGGELNAALASLIAADLRPTSSLPLRSNPTPSISS